MYKYYISFDSGSNYAEIFPVGSLEIAKSLENGTDSRNCFRFKWPEIKLNARTNSSEYATMLNWFSDNTKYGTGILLKKYRGDKTTGTLISTARFSIIDCVFNFETKTVSVTPDVYDDYKIFDEVKDYKIDSQVDIFTGAVFAHNFSVTTFNSITWVNSGFSTFTSSGRTITSAIGGSTAKCYDQVAVDIGSYVRVTITDYVLNSGTAPFMVLGTATDEVSDQTTVANGSFFLDAIYGSVQADRLWIKNNAASSDFTLKIQIEYFTSIADNFLDLRTFLVLMINDFLGASYDYTKIKSTFLFNDAVSSDCADTISTYMGTNPTHNYVTESVNKIKNLIITGINTLTGVWVKGEITFATFFNDLNVQFKNTLFWYIDGDSNFRIEHLKWFEAISATVIDLTSATYLKYKPDAEQKFSIDQSRLVQREYTKHYACSSEDFIGMPIIYSINATSEIIREYNQTILTTDIEYALGITEETDGLILINCEYDSDLDLYWPAYETGVLSGVELHNAHLSDANISENYGKYGRCAITGTMNGVSETFLSSMAYFNSQVKFALTTDIVDYQDIKTNFGTGKITSYKRTDNDAITAELKFNSY